MQIPFTALTVSCLGGSFAGVGVHEYRLSAVDKVEGLKVCRAKGFHAMRPSQNLTCVVLFFLRSVLLCRHHSHQIEHLMHADPHCIAEKGVYIQSVHSLCHVYTDEPHCAILHHLSLQPSAVSNHCSFLVLFHLTLRTKICVGHFYPGR